MRHPHLRVHLLVLFVALLAGCPDEDESPPAVSSTVTAAPPTPPPTDSPSEVPDKLTGLLSEKDFKALHELKGEAAPPPRGTTIALKSSKAYLSLPKNPKPPLPAVLVIHEWWGLNGHIQHWADRLTEDGYAALAVDLYGGEVAQEPDRASELAKAVDADEAKKKLLEAYAFLAEDDRIRADKRGSIGWCFGGKWSLELALEAPTLDAAVIYYGHVETNPERLANLQTPILAIFGERDKGIDEKYVDRFRFGLEQAGDKDVKIVTYDAEHAFANPSSARYDYAAAEKAWAETRGFLARHLRGPSR